MRTTAVRSLRQIGSAAAADWLVEIAENTAPEQRTLRREVFAALKTTARVEDLGRLEKIREGLSRQSPEWFILGSVVEGLRKQAGN